MGTQARYSCAMWTLDLCRSTVSAALSPLVNAVVFFPLSFITIYCVIRPTAANCTCNGDKSSAPALLSVNSLLFQMRFLHNCWQRQATTSWQHAYATASASTRKAANTVEWQLNSRMWQPREYRIMEGTGIM